MDAHNKLIAVVEENDADWETLRDILNSGGYYNIARFKSPREVFVSDKLGLCSLVLSEVDFGSCPVNNKYENEYFDGYELCSEVEDHYPQTGFIILTYRKSHRDIFRSWQSGTSAHLIKPAEQDGLILFVNAILRGVAEQEYPALSRVV